MWMPGFMEMGHLPECAWGRIYPSLLERAEVGMWDVLALILGWQS